MRPYFDQMMKQKNRFLLIVSSFLLLAEFALLRSGEFSFRPAEASSDKIEWEVSALCRPHAEVIHPSVLSVRFMPVSTVSGVSLNASLSIDGADERISLDNRFGLPRKGWISSRFEGPPVKARYFCQESPPAKNLRLSYMPRSDMQVSLNRDNSWGMTELDRIDNPSPKTVIEVKQSAKGSESYMAGRGSAQPYWLTFSMPVHSNAVFRTTLRYELQ